MSCVCGHPLCAQAAGERVPSLCSDCVPCVYGYPLCAQAVGKKCTRTVLRLCAVRVWVPALCSGCGQKVHPHCAQTIFFRFFPAGRMQHPLSTRNQKTARPYDAVQQIRCETFWGTPDFEIWKHDLKYTDFGEKSKISLISHVFII